MAVLVLGVPAPAHGATRPPSPAQVRGSLAALLRAAGDVRAADAAGVVGVKGETVAAGAAHTCAVTATGNLWCWGDNTDGQLGHGDTVASPLPVPVSDAAPLVGDTVIGLSAGRAHTCAVAESGDGTAFCWGANGDGQLGDGTTDRRLRPVPVLAETSQLSAGRDHTCAVRNDATVWCWGRNDQGQLGLGGTGPAVTTPTLVPGLADIVDIGTGDQSTCAVDEHGGAWCWGSDSAGQLGDGAAVAPARTPVHVAVPPAADGFFRVAVGRAHACALSGVNTAWCWGSDTGGQVGTAGGDTAEPALVPTAAGRLVVAVGAGGDSSCLVDVAGATSCWGANDHGQLGTGDTAPRPGPVDVARGELRPSPFLQAVFGVGEPMVAEVAVGVAHTCAVDVTAVVYCWGAGAAGQLGTGGVADSPVPVASRLGPGPVSSVAVDPADEALRVGWTPPAEPGAAPVDTYGAFAVRGLEEFSGCETRTALACTVGGLTNGRRYAVLVGVRTAAGLSFGGLTHGVPGGGFAGGLPVTGPDVVTWVVLAGFLLVTGTLAVVLVRGRRRRPEPPTR